MPAGRQETAEERLLRKAHEEIIRSQVERYHRDYTDYFSRKETEKLMKFFFEQIYDLEAQNTTIQVAINAYHKVKNQLNDHIRETIESSIELNQLTLALDRRMAEHLIKKGWTEGKKISIDEYFVLYKEVGLEAERREQLMTVLKNLLVSYRIAHRPLNDILLKAFHAVAVMVGVLPLYHFADDGYQATIKVSSDVFHEFIDKVTEVEMRYILEAFGE